MFFGFFIVSVLLIWGGVWIVERVLPWFPLIFWGLVIINLGVILPLGIFKRTRSISGLGLAYSSYFFGAILWLWSLVVVYITWGIIPVIIGLFIAGIGIVPIAAFVFIVNGEWSELFWITILFIITFGSRMLGIYFVDD